jgi:hypothetical protein
MGEYSEVGRLFILILCSQMILTFRFFIVLTFVFLI